MAFLNDLVRKRTTFIVRTALLGSISAILSLNLACSEQRSADHSRTKDLYTGSESDIAVQGFAQEMNLTDFKSLKVIPNTKIPKGILVHLVGNPWDGFNNWKFIAELYASVYKINEVEGLQRMPANPTPEDEFNQEVTFVLMYSKGAEFELNFAIQHIQEHMEATVPGFQSMKHFTTMETDSARADLWVQDFGEFALAEIDGLSEPVIAVLDANRNENRNVYSPGVFKDLFGIPLVKVGQNADNSAQYGGNTEATPDGVFYMGDSVDDPSYSALGRPSTMFEDMKTLNGGSGVKVSTDWLAVGHADEFMTYVPSRTGICDSAMLTSSPLEGLLSLLTISADEFLYYSSSMADQPIGYAPSGGSYALDITFSQAEIRSALQERLIDPSTGITGKLSDYNLSANDPLFTQLTGFSPVSVQQFFTQMTSARLAQFYVWQNLIAHQNIEKSAQDLLDTSACKQRETLPQVFLTMFNLDRTNSNIYYGKMAAHFPGTANSLVLRNHVIVPDPWIPSMRDAVKTAYEKHLGESSVQFVDDLVYHFALGEVHCATNVVRENSMAYTF